MGQTIDIGNEDIDNNILINNNNNQHDQQQHGQHLSNICLFGLSGSGKTTVYQHLRQLFSDESYKHSLELEKATSSIRCNMVLFIAILINETLSNYSKSKDNVFQIDQHNPLLNESIEMIKKYVPFKFDQIISQITPNNSSIQEYAPKFDLKNYYKNKKEMEIQKSLELDGNNGNNSDFGAYFNNESHFLNRIADARIWADFNHRTALVYKYFDCKLSHRMNPVKYTYSMSSDLHWTGLDHTITHKQLDGILSGANTTNHATNNNDIFIEQKLSDDDPITHSTPLVSEAINNNESEMKQENAKETSETNETKMDIEIEMEIATEKKEELPVSNVNSNDDVKSDNEQQMVDVMGEPMAIGQFWEEMKNLGKCIERMWELESIQKTYLEHHNRFYLPSNIDYFFWFSKAIFESNYIATEQHMHLNRNFDRFNRMQTCSLLDEGIKIMDFPCTTKWHIEQHWNLIENGDESIDQLIFTASLIDLFKVSFDSNNGMKNAFYCSMELFYECIHSERIYHQNRNKKTRIILLLTHKDRLIEMIGKGFCIKKFENMFDEWNWKPVESAEKTVTVGNNSPNHHQIEMTNTRTVNTMDIMNKNFDQFMQGIDEYDSGNTNGNNGCNTNGNTNGGNGNGNTSGIGSRNHRLLSHETTQTGNDGGAGGMSGIMSDDLNDLNDISIESTNLNINTTAVDEEEEKKISTSLSVAHDPNDHLLKKLRCTDNNGWYCSVCLRLFEENEWQYQCRECDFDLCGNCHSLKLKQEKELQNMTDVWIIDPYKGTDYCDKYIDNDGDDGKEEHKGNDDANANGNGSNDRLKSIKNRFLEQTGKGKRESGGNGSNNDIRNRVFATKEEEKEMWLIETYEGYVEWIESMYLKCIMKDSFHRKKQITFHCYTVNCIDTNEMKKVLLDITNPIRRQRRELFFWDEQGDGII